VQRGYGAAHVRICERVKRVVLAGEVKSRDVVYDVVV
jgi:hypothetical protein